MKMTEPCFLQRLSAKEDGCITINHLEARDVLSDGRCFKDPELVAENANAAQQRDDEKKKKKKKKKIY